MKLTVPEVRKAKIKGLADLVSDEVSFLGLWMAAFSWCPDTVRGEKAEGRGGKRKKREENMLREERRGVGWKVSSLVLLVTRTLILSDQGLTCMISFSLNCLLRGPISKYSYTLPTKVHLVKAMVFPMVISGCESWTIKKAEH